MLTEGALKMAPLWCCSDIVYQYLNLNVETWALKRHPYGAVMVASLSGFGLNTTHNSHMYTHLVLYAL